MKGEWIVFGLIKSRYKCNYEQEDTVWMYKVYKILWIYWAWMRNNKESDGKPVIYKKEQWGGQIIVSKIKGNIVVMYKAY